MFSRSFEKSAFVRTALAYAIASACSICGLASEPLPQPKPEPPTEQSKPEPAPMTATQATVEQTMEQAVIGIASRYNLNDEQLQMTRELMRRRVLEFLKEHENEIWPLIRDLMAAQLGNHPPDSQEEAKRIGKAALPIFEKAKKAILDGNEEWRRYLTDDQKIMHDFDMTEMTKTFGKIEQNFNAWAEGRPSRDPIFPAPEGPDKSPTRPAKPKGGLPKPRIDDYLNPNIFDAMVDNFLKEHDDLDQGQIDTARSIVQEYKAKAADFQNSNKPALTEMTLKLNEAHASRNREKLAEAEALRKQVLEPFHALVNELDERLKGLLTTAQKERHAQRMAKAQPASADATPAKTLPETPAPSPTSEPKPNEPPKEKEPGSGR